MGRTISRKKSSFESSAAPVEQIAPPSQSVSLDLDQALAALSSDDRDAFLLAEVGGLSYAEIAVASGSTVAAVRSRIYRARLALRERLMPPGRVETAVIQEHEEHV